MVASWLKRKPTAKAASAILESGEMLFSMFCKSAVTHVKVTPPQSG